MRSKAYLVTGGAGFLGAALVRRLVEAGHRVRVLDDQSRGSLRRLRDLGGNWEFVEADVRDTEAVARAASGMDGICHLAFINGTEFFYIEPSLVLDVGIRGMLAVLEACARHHIRELLLVSSSEVYQMPPAFPAAEDVPLVIPDPLNPRYSYAAGKIISEVLAINYGRSACERMVIVRPHNVYGPDMGWEHVIPQLALRIRALARAATTDPLCVPVQGTGQETRAFVFVDDCIEGLCRVMERGTHLGIYHVGTMEETTIASLAAQIAAYYGRQVQVVPGAPAVGSVRRRCPDTRKLAALGYAPQVSLEDGLRRTLAWYEAHAEERPAESLSTR